MIDSNLSDSNLSDWQHKLENTMRERLRSETDGSHDLAHLQRVWRHCQVITHGETNPVDRVALVAAAYLHDLVNLPKDHPHRSQASRKSAIEARELLTSLGYPQEKLATVEHAIEAHSFSANIATRSMEARILQDADRLDALGALGIARTFYIAGMLGSVLYDPDDPLAEQREPDDRISALDHYYTKLFTLPGSMHTATGRGLAMERAEYMREYLDRLKVEILGAGFR